MTLASVSALPPRPQTQPGQEEHVVRGPGIAVHHPPGRRQRAIDFLGSFLEQKAAILEQTGVAVLPEIRLDLFENGAAMNRRLREVTSYSLPPWTAGAAVAARNWIVIRLDAPGLESERLHGLLAHEVAHIAVGTVDRKAKRRVVPRWLNEGIAQVVEGRPFVAKAADLRPRAYLGTLISLDELEASFPEGEGASALAYTQAHAFTRWLELQYPGSDFIPAVLEELGQGSSLAAALEKLLGQDPAELEARWIDSLTSDRSWVVGILGKAGFAFLILFAVLFGAVRIVRRRRAVESRWEREEAAEQEAFGGNPAAPPFRPPLRRLGHDETPPEA